MFMWPLSSIHSDLTTSVYVSNGACTRVSMLSAAISAARRGAFRSARKSGRTMSSQHFGFAVFAKWACSNTTIMTSRRPLVALRTAGPAIYDLLGHVVLDETSYLPSLD